METVGVSVLGFAAFTAVAMTDIPSVRMLNSSGTPGRRLVFLRRQLAGLTRIAAKFIEYDFICLRLPSVTASPQQTEGSDDFVKLGFLGTSRTGPSPRLV